VILVDEVTQSSAEYTTMAFRSSPNAFVIGSTTAGADGNVSPIPLPGGLRTMISGIGVFYPDKRPTQRVGIVPDLEVKPTIAGIRAGRDELLEAALRRILGPDTPSAEIENLARAGRN
jgi:C-terminal processing protease CtpA/Prc